MPSVLSFLFLSITISAAQPQVTPVDRERARTQNRLGWEALRGEQIPQAIKSFQAAIEIFPDYEYAHYGLGRALLAARRFADAVEVLERSRDLYQAVGSRQFTNVQERQRYLDNRILEIDEQIRLLRSGPQTLATQDLARQHETIKRDLQEQMRRNQGLTIESTVPGFVSLSLGSAYFRSNRLGDAERAYRAAISADGRLGEAHNNLAVVYLETGKYAEAYASLQNAKKAGFRVNPQLEQAIRDKRP